MPGDLPLPKFRFRPDQPSLWAMLRTGIGDIASVIPETILDEWVVRLPGAGAPLVVACPELAREILNDRADHFTRDRFIRRTFRRSWGMGLAAAEGEDWQRQRKAAVPFFTPRSVQDYLSRFAQTTDLVLDQLHDGDRVDLDVLSARVVARIALSVLVDARDQVDCDAVARDIPAYIRRIAGFTAVDLLPLPETVIDRLQGIDRDPAVVHLRAMGSQLAAARADGTSRADMIALLEGIGPIADNIRGLFPAAMDTTVTGLGWALYVLAMRPDWQDRVAAEGQAMGQAPQLEQLNITRQVVNEVLRLYPPAPLLARAAAQDMDVGGFPAKAGQTIIVAAYAMHRHNRLWENPNAFDPDRFQPGGALPSAYMPFGTGPRMCIAAQFAQAEMAVILARMLARFRVETSGPMPAVSLKIATRACGGLPATLHRRQNRS